MRLMQGIVLVRRRPRYAAASIQGANIAKVPELLGARTDSGTHGHTASASLGTTAGAFGYLRSSLSGIKDAAASFAPDSRSTARWRMVTA